MSSTAMAPAIAEDDAPTRFTLADIDESEKTALLFGLCKSNVLRFFKQYIQYVELNRNDSSDDSPKAMSFDAWFMNTYTSNAARNRFEAIPGVIWDCEDMTVRHASMLGLPTSVLMAHQVIADEWLWRLRRIVRDLNKDTDLRRFKLPRISMSEHMDCEVTAQKHVKIHFLFTT